jgi:carbonic anhydrase
MLSPEQALVQLQVGNARYAGGTPARPNQTALRRAEVATSQNPFAVVVGCSDSRVPVEVIFDVGVGDLFVVRTAGNLIEDVCIASVEYAIAVLGVRLVMVMGHRRCGAVGSAVEATLRAEEGENTANHDDDSLNDRPRSYVEGLVLKMQPAVDRVRHAPGDLLDNAVKANVEIMVRRLTKRSSIINDAIKEGKVSLVGAVYDLDTGLVVLNQP